MISCTILILASLHLASFSFRPETCFYICKTYKNKTMATRSKTATRSRKTTGSARKTGASAKRTTASSRAKSKTNSQKGTAAKGKKSPQRGNKTTQSSSAASRRGATAKKASAAKRTSPVKNIKKAVQRVVGRYTQSSPSDALKKLLHDMLKDTMSAEKQLVKALPKMAKAATSEELKNAFTKHLSETENQVARLEEVFEACDLPVGAKKCEAMAGLVKEGEEAIKETEKGSAVRDVALIVAAQKVEHYEIAAYGSLRSITTVLGLQEAADLLQETLDEEGATDKTLTQIAGKINVQAEDEEDEDEDDEENDEDEEEEDEDDEKEKKADRHF
jgi:ferritin-like metal-binding protein YciE